MALTWQIVPSAAVLMLLQCSNRKAIRAFNFFLKISDLLPQDGRKKSWLFLSTFFYKYVKIKRVCYFLGAFHFFWLVKSGFYLCIGTSGRELKRNKRLWLGGNYVRACA